jgi:hypothetical protein
MKKWPKQISLVLLIVILLTAFGLRIQSFLDETFAYTYDVGRDMLVLSEITETLKPPLIGPTSGLHGLFYGPWWYYITLVPFALSGGDPKGVLLFMVLTGVLTSFVGYFFGKKTDGVILGLLVAAFVAVSPVVSGISKQIWNPNIAPLQLICIYLVLAFLFSLLFKEVKSKSSWLRNGLFFAFGLFLTLSIDAEIVYGSILFIFTCLFVFLSFRKNIRFLDLVFFGCGMFVILFPRIVFEMRHEFIMTQNVLQFLTGGSGKSFSLSIFETIPNRLFILFDLWERTLALKNSILGIVLIGFVLGGIGLFFKKASRIEKFFIGYSVTLIVGYFVTLSLFQQDIWDHYIVGVPIAYIVLFCLVVNLYRKHFSQTLVLLALGVLIIANLLYVYVHFPKPTDTHDTSFYRNHLSVVDYIYEHANGEPFNTITYTPPVHDYTYRYLFKWHGQKKYGYVPSTSNVKKFYVIVEPDNELPDRRGRWIQERSVDGVNLGEKNLDGGIIVQIREH